MAESHLISIVVPVHNSAAHLEACLSAIVSSDLPNIEYELIVVDDASTDSSRDIASRYTQKIICTGDSPRGPAFARNRGCEIARGETIAFVDSDVVVHPDALQKMSKRLDDASLVAVFGSYDAQPASDGAASQYRNLLHHYAHHESAGTVATFWAGCGAVKAPAFRTAKGFDERKFPRPQIEDVELGYRLARLGSILLDPEIQCKHLKHWTVASMMRTDFRDRAVPWVKLLLSRESAKGASTPSLGMRAVMGTATAGATAAAAFLAIATLNVWALVATIAFVAVCLALNANFYRFLFERGGVRLLLVGIPLHLLYQIESAVAVPVGITSYLARDVARKRDGSATTAGSVAGSRFVPLAFGETGARVIAFGTTAYLARTLGPSGFGQIGFAFAVVAHFGTALAVGIGEIGGRDVARAPDQATRIAAAGVSLRLLLAVAAIAAIIALTSVLNIDPSTRQITWLYALLVIPLALDTGWVYKGLGNTGRVGASLLLGQALVFVMVMLFVSKPTHTPRVPVVQLVGDFAAAAFLVIPLMRGDWRRPAEGAVKDIAKRSGMITVSRILRTVVISFDVVLLGLMVPTQQVGLYSAAYRIVFFVMALVYASHVAFLPEMARSKSEPRELSLILSRAVGLALTVTVPFVVGGILIASPLMNLIFGNEYGGGATALKLLLFSLLLLGIHGATRNVFLSLQQLRTETYVVAAGVVANVILNLILIPRFGITGAAVATVAGELVILVSAFAVLARFDISARVKESIPAIVSGVLMAAALLLFGTARPAWESVLVGGAVYGLAIGVMTLLARRRALTFMPEAG